MRTDDPIIIQRIQEIQDALDGLRQACRIQDPRDPNTELTKPPGYNCPEPGCSRMCRSQDDLNAHLRIDHPPVPLYGGKPVTIRSVIAEPAK